MAVPATDANVRRPTAYVVVTRPVAPPIQVAVVGAIIMASVTPTTSIGPPSTPRPQSTTLLVVGDTVVGWP